MGHFGEAGGSGKGRDGYCRLVGGGKWRWDVIWVEMVEVWEYWGG